MGDLREAVYEFFKDLNNNKDGIIVKDYINKLVNDGKIRQDEILGFRMRIYNILKGKITNLKDYIIVTNKNPLTLKLNSTYSNDELDEILKNNGFMTKKNVKKKKYSEFVRDIRQAILDTEIKNIISKANIIPWEDLDSKSKISYSMDIVKSTLLNNLIKEIIITDNINIFNEKILDSFNYVIFLDKNMTEYKTDIYNELLKLLEKLGLDDIKLSIIEDN